MADVRPVYFHDCPALGKHTRLPRALLADKEGKYILGYMHKCVFCNATAGEFEIAPGITLIEGGYTVDETKAEKLV